MSSDRELRKMLARELRYQSANAVAIADLCYAMVSELALTENFVLTKRPMKTMTLHHLCSLAHSTHRRREYKTELPSYSL